MLSALSVLSFINVSKYRKPFGQGKNVGFVLNAPMKCQTNTGILFSKVYFTPLHFYKRPTFVPVFTHRKKSNGIFTSMKEGKKQK